MSKQTTKTITMPIWLAREGNGKHRVSDNELVIRPSDGKAVEKRADDQLHDIYYGVRICDDAARKIATLRREQIIRIEATFEVPVIGDNRMSQAYIQELSWDELCEAHASLELDATRESIENLYQTMGAHVAYNPATRCYRASCETDGGALLSFTACHLKTALLQLHLAWHLAKRGLLIK